VSVGMMAGTGVVVVGHLAFEMDVLYLMNDDAAWLEREKVHLVTEVVAEACSCGLIVWGTSFRPRLEREGPEGQFVSTWPLAPKSESV
jgi:hypothetical protein